jgi:integrase/recombinase XerD
MMSPLSPWMSKVQAYLTYRRSQGYELKAQEILLKSFARLAETLAAEGPLTDCLALQWAQSSRSQAPITWARRIGVIRGFAQFCQRTDPRTQVPAQNLFGVVRRRLVPHIYSEAELSALLEATDRLHPQQGLRPATCRNVFGLLASAGLRLGEALALTREEVDLDTGLLDIRAAKLHKRRYVPLHDSATQQLRDYAQRRDRLIVHPHCNRFFLRDDGKAVSQANMLRALHRLCNEMGWRPRGDYPHHRLHDLRHTFIVRSVLRTYERDCNIDHAVMALSTYVGHANPSHTYWYVTGVPELMSIAAQRFERFASRSLT